MSEEQLHNAQEEVDRALAKAKEIKALSTRLGEGWRRSRADNNFRTMVRRLAPGGSSG